MELQTGEYQKLQIRQYPQRTLRETAEGRYWKHFRGTKILQQVGDPAASVKAAHSMHGPLVHLQQPLHSPLCVYADWRCHIHRLCRRVPLQLCSHQRHSRKPAFHTWGADMTPGMRIDNHVVKLHKM